MDAPDRERAGGLVVLGVVAMLVVLAGAGYVAAALGADDKVPQGARVGGIALGGQSADDAARTLRRGLADRLDAPMVVEIGSHRRSLRPSALGLSVDYRASVARTHPSRSWAPRELWDYYTAGGDHDPVVTVDQGRLGATLDRIAAQVSRDPRDATVRLGADGPHVTPSRPGLSLDVDTAGAALLAAFTTRADEPTTAPAEPLRLALVAVPPRIDDLAAQRAVHRYANPANAAPVVMRVGRTPVRLAPAQYRSLLTFVARGHRLVPQVDGRGLVPLVGRGVLERAGTDPVDATVRLVGARPQVVPDRPGTRYTPDDLAETLVRLATSTTMREGAVRGTPVRAEVRTADVRRWHVDRPIAAAAGAASGGDLTAALARLDGTVVAPGGSLSLLDALGKGVSAASATDLAGPLLDAGLHAGLVVEERHAPTTWRSGSTPGLDALADPSTGLDLRLRDDSPAGLLVSATRTAAGVQVRLWSSPRWKVQVAVSPRQDVTHPGTFTITSTTCTPRTPVDGFTVDVRRTRSPLHGPGRQRVDTLRTTYLARSGVTCRAPAPPPKPQPGPGPRPKPQPPGRR